MMINSRLGLEQGREVFAVPGVARSMQSKGTHRLLRQGAKLVESVGDVPEETILLRIVGKVPKHIDEIAQGARITAQRAAAMLLELELRGLVNQLPGKYFIS